MAYSTITDLQNAVGGAARLVELADWDNDNTADPAVVAAAIAEADGLINSFVARAGLHTPIDPAHVTVDIVSLSARHAVRVLRRNRQQVLASDVEDEKNDREWLKMLAKGEVFLGADPQPVKSVARVDSASARPSTKYVSRERLKGYW